MRAVALTVSILMLPAGAGAQEREHEAPSDASPAEGSEAAARDLQHHEAGRWAEARDQFVRAYELDPDPRLLFYIGDTYQQEGMVRQALLYYERFLAAAGRADWSRQDLEGYAARLRGALGHGSVAAVTEPAAKVEPALAEPGGEEVSATFSARFIAGSSGVDDRRDPARTAFWISLGATGAAAIFWGYSGTRVLHYQDRKDQAVFDAIQDGVSFDSADVCAAAAAKEGIHARRVDAACDRGKRWATTANVVAVFGALGAGVTGYLGYRAFSGGRGDVATARARRPALAGFAVSPALGRDSASLRVSLDF